jgi:ABC-type branched-subunit amino acid transport system permease subunit
LLEAIAHNGGFDFIIYGALVMLIAVIEPAGLVGLARRARRRLRL